jgi:hypothetical protein
MGLQINANLNSIANQARQLPAINNNLVSNQKINTITDKQLNTIAQTQMSASVAKGIQAVQQFQSINSAANPGQSLRYNGGAIPIYSIGSPDCDPTVNAGSSLRYSTIPIYSIRIRLMEQNGDFTAAAKAKLQQNLEVAGGVGRGTSLQNNASQNNVFNANTAFNAYTTASNTVKQQSVSSVLSFMG